MKAPLGKILPSKKKTFNFIIEENSDDLKVNFFLLSKQGTGKTNMLMLKVFYLYKAFIESGGKEGCIPIIFAPMFEYAKMSVPTNLENKEGKTPTGAKPQGIESLQYAFAMSNVPEYIKEDINLIALDFTSLTTEDIGVFAGISGNLDALGRVGKILAKLKEAGLSPSKPADKVALLRRAYYDLIGLPPSPKEVDDFLADNASGAYEKVVDRLLKSPHYGEKWGR